MNDVKFKRIVGDKGGVSAVTIPQELKAFLGVDNGDEVIMTAERGKHGKFIALYFDVEEE